MRPILDRLLLVLDVALTRSGDQARIDDLARRPVFNYRGCDQFVQLAVGHIQFGVCLFDGSEFGFGERYVAVNIPAAAVESVENGERIERYDAVVGGRPRSDLSAARGSSEL
jgi:hypothetical protein